MGNELSCSDGKTCDSDEFISCLENRSGTGLPGMPVRFTGHSRPDSEIQLSGAHSGGTMPDQTVPQTPGATARSAASKEATNRHVPPAPTSSSGVNTPHVDPPQDVLHPLASQRSGSQTQRQPGSNMGGRMNPLAPTNGAPDHLDREQREAAAKM